MNEGHTKKRGRPAKSVPNPSLITKAVIQFLNMFMTDTVAKRIVCLVLIVVGIPNERISELTGMCDRTIWHLKKAVNDGDVDRLFTIKPGGGRPGKTNGIEDAIVEELEKNNYHTRQQIADMILEKFGISMSVSSVGKLLKKKT